MTWTMDNQGVPAIAGARTLAALIVAAPMLALPVDSATGQTTAAQENAVRHYCRADFAAKCPGVIAREALICLEANLDGLSRNCKKAVLAALGEDPSSEPVAGAAPQSEHVAGAAPLLPDERASSRSAPIVSTAPPDVNPNAQRVKRRGAPLPVDDQASAEPPPNFAPPRRNSAATEPPPPPGYTAPRRGSAATAAPPPPNYPASRRNPAAHEAAAATDSAPPDSVPTDALPAPESEQVDTLPPGHPASRSVAPARRAKAATTYASPLVEACWNELNHNCAGVRPGGGRELACLTRYSRSLSPRCWDAYRTAWSRRR